MNLQQRLQRIKDAKTELEYKKMTELQALNAKKEEFRTKLVPYAQRIKDLLAIASELRANKLSLGKRKCGSLGITEDEFVTDGISHKFGFVIPSAYADPHRGELLGLGYEGGGCCGEADLIIGEDGRVLCWSDYMFRTRFDRIESDFLDFERRVYEYVDSL